MRFIILFINLVSILVFITSPGFASPVQSPQKTISIDVPKRFTNWSADRLYNYGTALLKSGSNYNGALESLKLATAMNPESADYTTAYGCANAARYAALCYYIVEIKSYSFYDKTYQQHKADWIAAQDDPKNPLFGNAVPQEPSRPTMPDGSVSPEETPKILQRMADSLAIDCIDSFDRARQLSKNGDSATLQEVEYMRGWALSLLLRYDKLIIRRASSDTTKAPVDFSIKAGAVESFRLCLAEDPTNEKYWQSLSLSLVPGTIYLEVRPKPTAAESKEAVEAMQKASELKPTNFDLLYQLSVISAEVSPEISLTALEKAIARRNFNGVLYYLLAQKRFELSDTIPVDQKEKTITKAVDAVKMGNASASFQSLLFSLPLPPLLKSAWDFNRVYGTGYDIRVAGELSQRLSAIAKKDSEKTDISFLLRDVETLMGIGLKLVSVYDATEFSRNDAQSRSVKRLRLGLGVAACHQALDVGVKANQAHSDERLHNFIAQYEETVQFLVKKEQELYP